MCEEPLRSETGAAGQLEHAPRRREAVERAADAVHLREPDRICVWPPRRRDPFCLAVRETTRSNGRDGSRSAAEWSNRRNWRGELTDSADFATLDPYDEPIDKLLVAGEGAVDGSH